jgi:hypothetical protein
MEIYDLSCINPIELYLIHPWLLHFPLMWSVTSIGKNW